MIALVTACERAQPGNDSPVRAQPGNDSPVRAQPGNDSPGHCMCCLSVCKVL